MDDKLREKIAKRAKEKVSATVTSVVRKSQGDTTENFDRIDPNPKPLLLAKYIRGAVWGIWDNAEGEEKLFKATNLRKALSEGVGTAGGFLVAPQWSNELIETLRASSVVRSLGATTYDLSGDTLNFKRVTANTAATWVGEAAAKPTTDPTFGQLKLVLKEVCGYTEVSNNLLMDASPAVDTLVKSDLVKSLQLAEDLAFLQGTGGVQPLGIRFDPATPSTVLGGGNGAIPTGDDCLDAMYAIENANSTYSGWVMHPRTKNSLRKLKDGNGQYIYMRGDLVNKIPDTLFGIPVALTTQIPTNLTYGASAANCSYAILANWPSYAIGQKSGNPITLSVSEHILFQSDSTAFRAVLRVDGAMKNVSDFYMIGGILP